MMHRVRVAHRGRPERREEPERSFEDSFVSIRPEEWVKTCKPNRQETGSYSSLFVVIMLYNKTPQNLVVITTNLYFSIMSVRPVVLLGLAGLGWACRELGPGFGSAVG